MNAEKKQEFCSRFLILKIACLFVSSSEKSPWKGELFNENFFKRSSNFSLRKGIVEIAARDRPGMHLPRRSGGGTWSRRLRLEDWWDRYDGWKQGLHCKAVRKILGIKGGLFPFIREETKNTVKNSASKREKRRNMGKASVICWNF